MKDAALIGAYELEGIVDVAALRAAALAKRGLGTQVFRDQLVNQMMLPAYWSKPEPLSTLSKKQRNDIVLDL